MSANKPVENQNKESLASHYALHVALQTMKERCLSLQQRLSAVEEENIQLRTKSGTISPFEMPGKEQSEVEILREKVNALTRQKLQLSEHIGMVAAENRQLWSRLSKLTKDNQTLGNSLDKIKDTLVNTGHQNLIRSKTFTQNSPNPILRQKMHDVHSNEISKELENTSLEEIPLKTINDIIETKSTDGELLKSSNSLGFGYLNDESIHIDFQNDTRKCVDNLGEIKKEMLRQQSDLKVILSSLRQRRVLEICSNCKNNANKAAKVDKNMGTTDENDSTKGLERNAYDHNKEDGNAFTTFMPIKPEHVNTIDILQQKRIADNLDKTCPMCGKVYASQTTFEHFQDHVESHFIDDSELDASIDKNYEFVSHTVGNF